MSKIDDGSSTLDAANNEEKENFGIELKCAPEVLDAANNEGD